MRAGSEANGREGARGGAEGNNNDQSVGVKRLQMSCAADAMVPRAIRIGEQRGGGGVKRNAAVLRFSIITRMGANELVWLVRWGQEPWRRIVSKGITFVYMQSTSLA